jgi:hypothetical protein
VAVAMKSTVFWADTLHFGEGGSFHREISIPFSGSKSKLSKILLISSLIYSSTLMMEAVRFPETLWYLRTTPSYGSDCTFPKLEKVLPITGCGGP